MPFYPDPDRVGGRCPYDMELYWESLVKDYTGMSIPKILKKLDFIEFYALRRDAYIAKLKDSGKEGIEYLNKCKTYEATEPDIEALQNLARGGKNG